jgi:hypothetical protein
MGEKKWTFFTNFFTEKLEMLNQCLANFHKTELRAKLVEQ